MAVSKRTRFEVLRRDEYTCRYCRSKDNPLRVDHVTPVALGGTDDPSNLVAACQDCNAGKSSSTLDAETVADINEDALRYARAMEQAGEMLAAKSDARSDYFAAFCDVWPNYRSVSREFEATVLRFYDLGLPVALMLEAADAAGNRTGIRDRQSYFAGICYKQLGKMREIAEQILAEGGE